MHPVPDIAAFCWSHPKCSQTHLNHRWQKCCVWNYLQANIQLFKKTHCFNPIVFNINIISNYYYIISKICLRWIDLSHLHIYQLRLIWLVTWKCNWLWNIREFVQTAAMSCSSNETSSLWLFPWKWSEWQNPDQERTNQNARNYLATTLPHNTLLY